LPPDDEWKPADRFRANCGLSKRPHEYLLLEDLRLQFEGTFMRRGLSQACFMITRNGFDFEQAP
jgi:hypothetical protein